MKKAPSIMEGWNIERETFRSAHTDGTLAKLVTEFSNACTLNCPGCFTVKLEDTDDIASALAKRKLTGEMSPETRLALLEEAVGLGARSVDIVGAGEPMIDPKLKPFVERASALGVHVNIFTHGAHRELLDLDRLSWWKDAPVSFVVKLWSQSESVNEILVRPKGRLQGRYTTLRDKAISNLIEAGFTGPTEVMFDGRIQRQTRVGADILATQENYHEIVDLFRFCRRNNIMPEIKNFIPQGPSKIAHEEGHFDALPEEVRVQMLQQKVGTEAMRNLRKLLDQVDRTEFGNEALRNFYTAGTFCTQSMGALYVPISGQIYSCVGTGFSYGQYRPGENMLRQALNDRRERVGFGCFPRLEDADRNRDSVADNERVILEQQ